MPPGAYRNFIANGGSGFTLGVAGSVQPVTYSFERLTLNGQSMVEVIGPVILHLGNGFNANGVTGVGAHPEWLQIMIATGVDSASAQEMVLPPHAAPCLSPHLPRAR
ncbi:MAG: hypothetical protein ABI680_12875 [Chthoniobacteraceae bacterium]